LISSDAIAYLYEGQNSPTDTKISNRLAEQFKNSTSEVNYQYDSSGNLLRENSLCYFYDERGRLSTVGWVKYIEQDCEKGLPIVEYRYDWRSLRVFKYLYETDSEYYYIYNKLNQLVGEYVITEASSAQPNGGPLREYIYLAGRPIAMVATGTMLSGGKKYDGLHRPYPIYSIHPDLNRRPARLTDSSGDVVWTAAYDAFGNIHASEYDEDPDANGESITINLRGPGQYHDRELDAFGKTSYYNWHRYYDPTTGRYNRPEPLIAAQLPSRTGGVPNTYTYAGHSPTGYYDANGLWVSAKNYAKYVAPLAGGGLLIAAAIALEFEAVALAALAAAAAVLVYYAAMESMRPFTGISPTDVLEKCVQDISDAWPPFVRRVPIPIPILKMGKLIECQLIGSGGVRGKMRRCTYSCPGHGQVEEQRFDTCPDTILKSF